MIETTEAIARQRVLPVLRCADAADAVATARAAARGGMSVIELTMTTPGVRDALQQLAGDGLTLGLGTVERVEDAVAAVELGASFIVSFHNPSCAIAAGRAAGALAIPAALTPGEVAGCRDAGAQLVKLFPARLLTPAYLGDLRAVVTDIRFIATGGIAPNASAIQPWLDAGAVAVGLGAALGTVARDGSEEVERRCRAAVAAALRSTAGSARPVA